MAFSISFRNTLLYILLFPELPMTSVQSRHRQSLVSNYFRQVLKLQPTVDHPWDPLGLKNSRC